ncbi:hypothetical protein COV04_02510 [Candidatus Uhrbacteria bacterium CG10_big_fil_rev_8_21_14_0_10_48_11]|uniref:Histidine kinase N-terminal 7TM region domain-containing protein n=1 Tax=Candidatus Uhrbacteria bacterium CG10_big_fil_rev_8_21_14_0_10_48_11 TaxID=1975037 RepID=A0A2M8LEA9_9BACT|nr:MAG: hypothetical protein COV04_02510 [Candidatus Uhrbacteria bacterium CG10_big_fil_rev_8_21_14_0_10_48_11]
MIPIIPIASFISALVSLGATTRVFSLYRQRKNEALWYFGAWFAVVTIMFLNYALGGIVASGVGNAVIDAIGNLFIYVSCVLLIQIPFIFLDRREWGVISGIILATAGLVFFIGLLLNPSPSVREVVGPYVFWWPQYEQWLRSYTGVVAGTTTLTFTLTFLYLGYRGRSDMVVFRRSAYLAAGMFSLMLSALSILIVPKIIFVERIVLGATAMVAGIILLYYGLLWMPGTISEVSEGSQATKDLV